MKAGSTEIAVRHTPLTATLSPAANSAASGDSMRTRAPPLVSMRSTSLPVASIRPVNISFDQHVGTKRLDVRLEQAARREPSLFEKRHAARPHDDRRDIHAHEIDEPFVPRGAVHGRAT